LSVSSGWQIPEGKEAAMQKDTLKKPAILFSSFVSPVKEYNRISAKNKTAFDLLFRILSAM
jgi:hypothetical protein